MKTFEEAIHGLTLVRAERLQAALATVYEEGTGYWSNPVFALFRDGLPTEADMEQRTCRTLSKYLNINDGQLATEITDAYSHYGYHCLSHAILTAVIAKRLAEIYLPHHPDMQRIVILAALLHDAFHSHGHLPDSENIQRAQRFTRHLMAVHGTRLGYPPSTESICREAISLTEFNGAGFVVMPPASLACPSPVDPDAQLVDQINMVKRILCESDVMMSATPLWPVLGGVLAHDLAKFGHDAMLDVAEFCATQVQFTNTQVLPRMVFKETCTALIAVREMHCQLMEGE